MNIVMLTRNIIKTSTKRLIFIEYRYILVSKNIPECLVSRCFFYLKNQISKLNISCNNNFPTKKCRSILKRTMEYCFFL